MQSNIQQNYCTVKKGPKELMRLCHNALNLIEDARSQTEFWRSLNKAILETVNICLYCIASDSSISPKRLQHFLENCEEIEACVKGCIERTRLVISKTENYFGLFEVFFTVRNILGLIC